MTEAKDGVGETMIAPTEKHLEDWLVANPNQIPGGARNIVGRQVVLPSGVLDIIATRSNRLQVIELKKRVVDFDTVAQTLRYMGDIQGIYESVVTQMESMGTLSREEYEQAFGHMRSYIEGIIIGWEFKNKHMPVVCEAANIILCTYDLDGVGDYHIMAQASAYGRFHTSEYGRYFNPDIALAIKNYVFELVER